MHNVRETTPVKRKILEPKSGGSMGLTPFSTIFQLYRAFSFIGGGNLSTQRKRPTCR